MYKPMIAFWYTSDDELTQLLREKEFANQISVSVSKVGSRGKLQIIHFKHYKLYAIKTDSISTAVSIRAIKFSKVLMSKSFYGKLSKRDVYDYFKKNISYDLVGSGKIDVVNFLYNDNGNVFWSEVIDRI